MAQCIIRAQDIIVAQGIIVGADERFCLLVKQIIHN